MSKSKVLIFSSKLGYQARMFAEAAVRLGVAPQMATDRCDQFEDPWGDGAISSTDVTGTYDAVVAVGDKPAYLAGVYAERAGLRFHSVAGLEAAKNKFLARERFRAAGLLVPEYFRLDFSADPASANVEFPCVLKPLGLSASQGVIRADNRDQFGAAFERIRKIVGRDDSSLQVERFIPGREYALDGLMTGGQLQVLAVFDKPDPLDGPFFEETIYLTPSRGPVAAIAASTQRAAAAMGLRHGPIHAELRVNGDGVWMLEVAGRPIGGVCARMLRFEGGVTLEEVIIRHSLGEDMLGVRLEGGDAGVMMIPIPHEGIYRGVSGVAEAERFAEVMITAGDGQHFRPLPEGNSYLGFLFAWGDDVAARLRAAHGALQFDLAKVLKTLK